MSEAKATQADTRLEPYQIVQGVLGRLYRAEQLDTLHLSIINLLDMVTDEEISLVLEQPNRSEKEKLSFLRKIADSVRSPDLRSVLEDAINRKDLDFFDEKELGDLLRFMQATASKLVIVKLTVALEFKETDWWEIATSLGQRIKQQVVLSIKVDPTLIGGAIIQFGSYLSDYSLRTRLDLFRRQWHKAVVEA